MPPLMGAGAFVMVELTRVPYTEIMAAALLPAVLYFFAVWVGINAYARRHDLAAIDRQDQPDLAKVMITSAFFMVPFLVLLWGMFGAGYTPQYAACIAILAGFALLFFNARGTFRIREILERLESAVLNAAARSRSSPRSSSAFLRSPASASR